MKKLLILPLILSAFLLSGCGKSGDIWQGSYYEHGDQKKEAYGPVFNNYDGCKLWALGKVVNSDDKVNCSKNCHSSIEDVPVCEDVVRNWAPFPGSATFSSFKE